LNYETLLLAACFCSLHISDGFHAVFAPMWTNWKLPCDGWQQALLGVTEKKAYWQQNGLR